MFKIISSRRHIVHLCLLVIMVCFSLNAMGANRRSVDPDRLPWTAQKFIRKHMWTCVPIYAYRDNRGYEVFMNDNSIVRFDYNGKWKQINCTEGVPDRAIPVNIRIHLVNRFPHYTVIWIKRMPKGYQLELSNGMRLIFNKNGKLLKVM